MQQPKLKLSKIAFAVRWALLSEQDRQQFLSSAFGKNSGQKSGSDSCEK